MNIAEAVGNNRVGLWTYSKPCIFYIINLLLCIISWKVRLTYMVHLCTHVGYRRRAISLHVARFFKMLLKRSWTQLINPIQKVCYFSWFTHEVEYWISFADANFYWFSASDLNGWPFLFVPKLIHIIHCRTVFELREADDHMLQDVLCSRHIVSSRRQTLLLDLPGRLVLIIIIESTTYIFLRVAF